MKKLNCLRRIYFFCVLVVEADWIMGPFVIGLYGHEENMSVRKTWVYTVFKYIMHAIYIGTNYYIFSMSIILQGLLRKYGNVKGYMSDWIYIAFFALLGMVAEDFVYPVILLRHAYDPEYVCTEKFRGYFTFAYYWWVIVYPIAFKLYYLGLLT